MMQQVEIETLSKKVKIFYFCGTGTAGLLIYLFFFFWTTYYIGEVNGGYYYRAMERAIGLRPTLTKGKNGQFVYVPATHKRCRDNSLKDCIEIINDWQKAKCTPALLQYNCFAWKMNQDVLMHPGMKDRISDALRNPCKYLINPEPIYRGTETREYRKLNTYDYYPWIGLQCPEYPKSVRLNAFVSILSDYPSVNETNYNDSREYLAGYKVDESPRNFMIDWVSAKLGLNITTPLSKKEIPDSWRK